MHLMPAFHHKMVAEIRTREAPYRDQEMILRDYLAADRTAMANERLLLAYIRTALATIGAGAAIVHFQPTPWGMVFGGMLAGSGIIIGAIGLYRFQATRETLGLLKRTSHAKELPREGR